MDIKIGGKTYGPDASAQKVVQEDSKYTGTKKPLGITLIRFRVISFEIIENLFLENKQLGLAVFDLFTRSGKHFYSKDN